MIEEDKYAIEVTKRHQLGDWSAKYLGGIQLDLMT